jgi:medium-chain acyl-[acyl-carrier-protein] hydrolase
MTAAENGALAVETPYIWRARRPGCSHRLICFPYAGASAGVYADWAALLPPQIELAAVQLPGRMNRIAEAPATEFVPLIRLLAQALRPVLDGRFSFYGHSGGALLAFELARALRSGGRPRPDHLFVSGYPAPSARWEAPQLHALPDKELTAEIAALGGIDPEIAEDDYMMGALLPTLRADFALCERHRADPGPPLDVPITVLTGDADPRAPLDTLDGWREQTDRAFRIRQWSGGHFYFLGRTAELTRFISRTMLDSTMAGRTS